MTPSKTALRHPGFRSTAASTLAVLALALLGSCASPQMDESSMGTTLPAEHVPLRAGKLTPIERDYEAIRSAHEKGELDRAIELASRFEKRHPKAKLLPATQNVKGLCFLQKKQLPQAILNFKRAVNGSTQDKPKRAFYAFNLASAQFENESFEDAQKTLDQTEEGFFDARTRVKYHYLRSRVAEKRKQTQLAANHVFQARAGLNDPTLDANWKQNAEGLMVKQLDRVLEGSTDVPMLEALSRDFEGRAMTDIVLYHLGKAAQANRNVGLAENSFRTILLRYPQSQYAAKASEEIRAVAIDVPVDRNKIGVLLPMTGKFAKYGLQSLHGIELAFNIYQHRRGDANNYRLIIEDSGDTPEQALAALDRLNRDHSVIAVIGPMLSKGIEEVSKRAQDIGVPLMSLTQQRGIDGDFIFYAAVSPRNQTQELAKYAFEKLGLRRFGIVAPANKFGDEFTQSFWDAIEALGGQVTACESYDPKETDFRAPVDKMVGLFYPEARSRELEAMAKYRKENNIIKKTRMSEKYFTLKPVIDFDAVFIPDEAKVSSQIIPTFAYRDVDKMRFLGTSAWNSTKLVERAASTAIEGSIFVDSFFAKSPTVESQRFLREFESVFGYSPTGIEALSYDAARILDATLTRTKSGSRSTLRDGLAAVQEFPGATGRISYKEGRLYHQLQVLTIQRKQISLAP